MRVLSMEPSYRAESGHWLDVVASFWLTSEASRGVPVYAASPLRVLLVFSKTLSNVHNILTFPNHGITEKKLIPIPSNWISFLREPNRC